jgi:hypothetical protein
MQQSTVALIGAVVAVGGTLGGVFLGQRMNKDAQREQWVRDNRKEESRELLNALAVAYWGLIDWNRGLITVQLQKEPITVTENGATDKFALLVADTHKVFGSRLLVAKEVKKAEIHQRWLNTCAAYIKDREEKNLTATYDKLCELIVEIGLKS